MKVHFFCSLWGMHQYSIEEAFEKIKKAGYDGVEMAYISGDHQPAKVKELARYNQLELIVAQVFAQSDTFEGYAESFTQYIKEIASMEPLYIISQTGRDYYSFEQNSRLIELSEQLSEELSIKIIHETHRGRFSFHGPTLIRYLKQFPKLRINADFSHWCVVSESLLEEQSDILQAAVERSDHIHARVGHSQAAQVTDPRAPEWEETLASHLSWWDDIIASHKNTGSTRFNITPEFGPEPYLPCAPYTQEPLANQWELNLYMKELLEQRYNQI